LLTSIAGRVAIVTGASKGVGKGIASVLVHHGVKVLVVSRNRVEATATAVELGDGAVACAVDVATWEESVAMAEAAADHFSDIDILCANAGIFPKQVLSKWTRTNGTTS
jgi:3-oxoacyl-[acyl-carrier protein] reductase